MLVFPYWEIWDGMLVHHRVTWVLYYEVTWSISTPPPPPPGWDASPSQGYHQHFICWYPFVHLGGERDCESKVSCPRTQQDQ